MFEIGGLIGGVAGALRDLQVDEDAVADVVARLEAVADDVSRSGFHDVDLPGGAFGGSHRGQALGLHHQAAYNVVAETLRGIVQDLADFGAGVTRAVELVKSADETSAADLQRQAVAVETLTFEAHHRDADRLHDQARDAQERIPDIAPAEPSAGPSAEEGTG